MTGMTIMMQGVAKAVTGASVSISPSVLSDASANGTPYSATATATPSGITSPTYLWSWASGGTNLTLTNTTTATVTVTLSGINNDVERIGELQCVVSGTGGPKTSSIIVDVRRGTPP